MRRFGIHLNPESSVSLISPWDLYIRTISETVCSGTSYGVQKNILIFNPIYLLFPGYAGFNRKKKLGVYITFSLWFYTTTTGLLAWRSLRMENEYFQKILTFPCSTTYLILFRSYKHRTHKRWLLIRCVMISGVWKHALHVVRHHPVLIIVPLVPIRDSGWF